MINSLFIIYIIASLLVLISTIQPTQNQEKYTKYETLLLPLCTIMGGFLIYLLILVMKKTYINIIFTVGFVIIGYWSIIANLLFFFEFFEYRFEEAVYGEVDISDFEEILIDEKQQKVVPKNKTKKSIFKRFWKYIKGIFTSMNLEYFIIYCIGISICVVYIITRNPIVASLISISVCYSTIRVVKLDRVLTGWLHLSILFFYDLFSFFYHKRMEKIMEGIDSPIVLFFPQHFHCFEMIGLGDIFIPGLYICVVKKYCEVKMDRKMGLYWCTYISYNIGLIITLFSTTFMKYSLPALIFISPSMICFSLLFVAYKGRLKEFVAFKR